MLREEAWMAARPTLKDQLFSLMSSLTTEELKALEDMNLSEEFEERETSARERSRGEDPLTTEIVTRMCLRHDLPILSPEQHECACGRNPSLLGEGAFGIARLNREKGLVLKVAQDEKMMPSMLTEAKVLMLLRGLPHVQQLVGVCPEQRSLVTKYGGPTLREHLETLSLSTKQKAQIAGQLGSVLSAFHAVGIEHCDLSANNICVDLSHLDPVVTIIDFGLCALGQPYADVQQFQQILFKLFPGSSMAPSLQEWLFALESDDPHWDGLDEALRDQLSRAQ